ncbi:MAG: MBOAT family O-acyltransferase [Prolixibacteraceae bacterium]|jgi:D-alanyl-lipoteichoic acid acyltransferase DltB (MBOAT superfamily)|nr:MBOAT family O-acyltransferase [Prolixibacteraceae bacterium]
MNILETIWPDWFLYSGNSPMFFTSLLFWVFFVLFLGIYSLVFSRMKLRNAYLLMVSLFFYFKINGFYFLLLLFSCLMNYSFGILIAKSRQKKLFLVLAVSSDLLMLGFYKYAVFFTETVNHIFSARFRAVNWLTCLQNELMGGTADIYDILLPIGISFYTFQAISYLVDVYRKQVQPVRNFLDFSFYLSFFPQLVAGPIVRASYFIPQLYRKYKLSRQEFSHSLYLILKGLFKKMVIADFLAINFVDRVFDTPLSYSGMENLLALFSYSIQIYCDFSGYTDIAIGLALMLGFKIPVNFNAPYQATNLTDFWHRWHISLSTWLKDYLYIPLGGNRKGKFRMYLNLLAVMVLGGLWHGANLRFMIWGSLHGCVLVAEKMFRSVVPSPRNLNSFWRLVSVFSTFLVVSFAWIFFRLESNEKVRQFFYQVGNHLMPRNPLSDWAAYQNVLFVFVLGLLLIWTPFHIKEKIRGNFIASPMVVQIFVSIILLTIISIVARSEIQPFIYFRF